MQQNSEITGRINFLVGTAEYLEQLTSVPARKPFDAEITEFLNTVSGIIMKNPESRLYSDAVSFAFWIRKGSVAKMAEQFSCEELRLGKGVAFHIAPSNVPVNFAFSLASALLMGNANVVRIPAKDFPQVRIISEALNSALELYPGLKPYVICCRYDHDSEINDFLSSLCDVRILWGGDNTIAELRQSPLPSRSTEITFADRYSLAVIDSDRYLATEDKKKVAEDFYNDTFFSDQNACTSPRIIVWTGEQKEEAKEIFWEEEHKIARGKYTLQPIQSVNKLTQALRFASKEADAKIEKMQDNFIVRVRVAEITEDLMDYKESSGYFYEYDCDDIADLFPLCNDKKCQTISYLGEKEMLLPLLEKGVKGIDRVVPMGRTMDFELFWDGYDLPALLTRTVILK